MTKVAVQEDMEAKVVYSFDVFDTCITRTNAFPRDLFFELGLRLAPAGLSAEERQHFAADFQVRRIRAEQLAYRRARPHENASIHHIYELFEPPAGLGLGVEALVQAEVDLEAEHIYPIESMLAHLADLRRAGHRIIFISDMYLPADLLEPILRKHAVMQDGDRLYVSCDAGVSKHSGRLFDHVLQAEGIAASDLVHTGDNEWADIRRAAEKGIRSRHVKNAWLTAAESRVAGGTEPRARARSYAAALSRQVRLALQWDPETDDQVLDRVVHSTIVPFLVTYVLWVLDHAERTGVKRLYFVARDGEILYRIARELVAGRDTVEVRYLYASRRAWLPPSIVPGTEDWHRFVVTAGQSNSHHDIASRFGLDSDDEAALRTLFAISPEQWQVPMPYAEASRFLKVLLANAQAMDIIFASAAQKREVALRYFEQEGLLDDVPWALVDAGWALNSQAALKRILDASGRAKHGPRGYYIALTRDHLDLAKTGPATPFVAGPGSYFSRRRVVIEHCFLPSQHTTTRGYGMEGERAVPVFGRELRTPREMAYVARLHNAAVVAAKCVAADRNLRQVFSAHPGDVVAVVEEFLRRPPAAEAHAMAPFGTVADLRHESAFVEPLCRPLTLADLWLVLKVTLRMQTNPDGPSYMWLEGSTALSPFYVRLPLRIMLNVDAFLALRRSKA